MGTGSLNVNRDIILATKRQYVKDRKRKTPIEAVLALAAMQRRPRTILNTITDGHEVAIIGQITRSETYDPVSTALQFAQAGVDSLAFFTDHSIYRHDMDDMLMVARGVKQFPIIAQNYIEDEYSVIAARAADASGLVLYSALLEPDTLRRVVSMTQRWKMTTILQVNEAGKADLIHQLSPHVVAFGDNLSKDIHKSLKLLEAYRDQVPFYTKVMLMNCLHKLADVEAAVDAGVEAIIVSGNLLLNGKASKLHEIIHWRKYD